MARGLIEVAAEIRPLVSFLLYIIPQPLYFSLLFTPPHPSALIPLNVIVKVIVFVKV